MTARVLPFAMLLAVTALAATACTLTLQIPVPSPGESEGSPQDERAEEDQETPNIVRESEDSPVTVRISRAQEDSEREQEDRERQATTNRWLIGLTLAIAAFTGGLVWVGILQRRTYENTLATNKTIERTYIDMSHTSETPDWDGL